MGRKTPIISKKNKYYDTSLLNCYYSNSFKDYNESILYPSFYLKLNPIEVAKYFATSCAVNNVNH